MRNPVGAALLCFAAPPASTRSLTCKTCSTPDDRWMKSTLLLSDAALFYFLLVVSDLLLILIMPFVHFVQLFTKLCLFFPLLSTYSLPNRAVVLMHVSSIQKSLSGIALAQSLSKIPDGHFHALSVRSTSKFYQHLKVSVSEKISSLLRTICCSDFANGAFISWSMQLKNISVSFSMVLPTSIISSLLCGISHQALFILF